MYDVYRVDFSLKREVKLLAFELFWYLSQRSNNLAWSVYLKCLEGRFCLLFADWTEKKKRNTKLKWINEQTADSLFEWQTRSVERICFFFIVHAGNVVRVLMTFSDAYDAHEMDVNAWVDFNSWLGTWCFSSWLSQIWSIFRSSSLTPTPMINGLCFNSVMTVEASRNNFAVVFLSSA